METTQRERKKEGNDSKEKKLEKHIVGTPSGTKKKSRS